MRDLADMITTDAPAIALLLTAAGGFVASVGALIGVILTHRKVTTANTNIDTANTNINSVASVVDTVKETTDAIAANGAENGHK